MSKKLILIFTLIISSLFFDFFRDYVFQNINFQIHYLSHFRNGISTTFNMTDSRMLSCINHLSIPELEKMKWVFSLLFICTFQLITIFLSENIFQKKGLIFFFPITFILSCFSLLAYYFSTISDSLNHSYSFYYISIEISHFLQSSLIVISMLMIFKVYLLLNTSSNK